MDERLEACMCSNVLKFKERELARKTNIPAVLMLIILGICLKLGLDAYVDGPIDFLGYLELLGIVGLIMIVLEAALELELKREKLVPIAKALTIALLGLFRQCGRHRTIR